MRVGFSPSSSSNSDSARAQATLRLEPGDLAPAGDLVVGLDLDVRLGADRRGLEAGDADRGIAVFHLGGRTLPKGCIQRHAARGRRAHRTQQGATIDPGFFRLFAHGGLLSNAVRENASGEQQAIG